MSDDLNDFARQIDFFLGHGGRAMWPPERPDVPLYWTINVPESVPEIDYGFRSHGAVEAENWRDAR